MTGPRSRMRVLVVARDAPEALRRRILRDLTHLRVDSRVVGTLENQELDRVNMAIVLGGDREVLKAVHELQDVSIPLLGVSEADTRGFLTEIGVSDFAEEFARVAAGRYSVEEALRIGGRVDGEVLPPALNEVAVFASRSATLVEYALEVDGEQVWRDYSDGVIVATPTGSTAYAMSAGGPVVHVRAPVLTIVSANSMDVTRRPLVVADTSRIRITDVVTQVGAEAVVDGTVRVKVKDTVEVIRAEQPARLVRLPESSQLAERMAKKVRFAEELLKMPPSAKLILKTLEYEGPLSQRELTRRTMLPERTARLALTQLIEKGLVRRRSLLRDPRQKIYYAA